MQNKSDRISFTNRYTSAVWKLNHLDSDAKLPVKTAVVYYVFQPLFTFIAYIFSFDMVRYLLQRHYLIDMKIDELLKKYQKITICEIGCGHSPRSERILNKYGASRVSYYDMDLPAVINSRQYPTSEGHFLVACDILAESGELSLEKVLADCEQNEFTLIITEGVINYFQRSQLEVFGSVLLRS